MISIYAVFRLYKRIFSKCFTMSKFSLKQTQHGSATIGDSSLHRCDNGTVPLYTAVDCTGNRTKANPFTSGGRKMIASIVLLKSFLYTVRYYFDSWLYWIPRLHNNYSISSKVDIFSQYIWPVFNDLGVGQINIMRERKNELLQYKVRGTAKTTG